MSIREVSTQGLGDSVSAAVSKAFSQAEASRWSCRPPGDKSPGSGLRALGVWPRGDGHRSWTPPLLQAGELCLEELDSEVPPCERVLRKRSRPRQGSREAGQRLGGLLLPGEATAHGDHGSTIR